MIWWRAHKNATTDDKGFQVPTSAAKKTWVCPKLCIQYWPQINNVVWWLFWCFLYNCCCLSQLCTSWTNFPSSYFTSNLCGDNINTCEAAAQNWRAKTIGIFKWSQLNDNEKIMSNQTHVLHTDLAAPLRKTSTIAPFCAQLIHNVQFLSFDTRLHNLYQDSFSEGKEGKSRRQFAVFKFAQSQKRVFSKKKYARESRHSAVCFLFLRKAKTRCVSWKLNFEYRKIFLCFDLYTAPTKL